MRKTLYRWKILITDFFNKIPAVILIPGILLAAFLIAILLIWSGTKVAVIDVAEPYGAGSNTNATRSQDSGANKNNNIDNNFELNQDGENNSTLSGPEDQNNGAGLNPGSTAGQTGNGTGGSAGGGGNPVIGGSQGGSANSNTVTGETGSSQSGSDRDSSGSSSSSSGEITPETAKRLPSTSQGTAEEGGPQNTNVSENCTYPEGDVELWWRRSTKKQRDCYIKKNGYPDFLGKEPYFCDYEKNEDCYVQ